MPLKHFIIITGFFQLYFYNKCHAFTILLDILTCSNSRSMEMLPRLFQSKARAPFIKIHCSELSFTVTFVHRVTMPWPSAACICHPLCASPNCLSDCDLCDPGIPAFEQKPVRSCSHSAFQLASTWIYHCPVHPSLFLAGTPCSASKNLSPIIQTPAPYVIPFQL